MAGLIARLFLKEKFITGLGQVLGYLYHYPRDKTSRLNCIFHSDVSFAALTIASIATEKNCVSYFEYTVQRTYKQTFKNILLKTTILREKGNNGLFITLVLKVL